MTKKKTKKPSDKRSPALIPVSALADTARQIAKLQPNETIIFNNLKEIYEIAFDEGYQRRIGDDKYFKSKREAAIKKSFDSVYRTIEDTIHGGVIQKNEELPNQNTD
jgi:hypothetical protein